MSLDLKISSTQYKLWLEDDKKVGDYKFSKMV